LAISVLGRSRAGKISSRRSSPGCIGGKPRFRGFLVMIMSSVIIFQIDVDGIAFDPAKCNAPVSAGVEVRSKIFRSDASRAAQFLYLNRTCWNGLYRENLRGEFNVPRGTKDTVIFDDDDFEAVSEALASAKITTGDFEKVLDGVKEGDFVFIDPPYTVKHNGNGFVKYNESIFSWNDQLRLAKSVKSKALSGASILVTNAYHPTVVDLYRDFATVVPVERASILSGDKSYRGKTQEALILVGSAWRDLDLKSTPEPATIGHHQPTS
jgi:D12 class N6 adenine-specific DNA methyltransferase